MDGWVVPPVAGLLVPLVVGRVVGVGDKFVEPPVVFVLFTVVFAVGVAEIPAVELLSVLAPFSVPIRPA